MGGFFSSVAEETAEPVPRPVPEVVRKRFHPGVFAVRDRCAKTTEGGGECCLDVGHQFSCIPRTLGKAVQYPRALPRHLQPRAGTPKVVSA